MRSVICVLIGHRWSSMQLTIGRTRLRSCTRCGHVHSTPILDYTTAAGNSVRIRWGSDDT